jgi:hypothetical protein
MNGAGSKLQETFVVIGLGQVVGQSCPWHFRLRKSAMRQERDAHKIGGNDFFDRANSAHPIQMPIYAHLFSIPFSG